ncbi:helix-turn-helix transcriptional regulator [soil metagenome]
MATGTTETQHLLAALKRELRIRRITYRDVAEALELSEPSVKRLFSTGRFTLERLAQVAALLDLSLAELIAGAADARLRLHEMTVEQESTLVSDAKLLLIAVCVLNHWTAGDIVQRYRISEPECVQRLVRLDRMRLIDLLPGNRVRLNVARDFSWLPEGPISRFFRDGGEAEFLNGRFDVNGHVHLFVNGMLSQAAAGELQALLRRLRTQFDELHQESLKLPLEERHGTGLLLATRQWEPSMFAALRRPVRRQTG